MGDASKQVKMTFRPLSRPSSDFHQDTLVILSFLPFGMQYV